MSLDYRVTPLPDVWPGKATPSYSRKRAPFKANWSKTLTLLEREIRHLAGTRVEIAVDVEPRHLRNDGQLRADARTRSSAVIVSFTTGKDRLQFPADRFAFWQDNVDAIARALEALRMVDRYGVQQGRQYTGFKALPASTAPTMSASAAADVIVAAAGGRAGPVAILADREQARVAVRAARATTHPDRTGDRTGYDQVDAAAAVLAAHFGGAL